MIILDVNTKMILIDCLPGRYVRSQKERRVIWIFNSQSEMQDFNKNLQFFHKLFG